MNPKYLRMIKRMDPSGPQDWAVYMLRCEDGSLYTGIAKDAAARFRRHQSGKGAAYTRAHPPRAMVYHETGFTRSAALMREAAVKRLSKEKKEELAKSPPTGGQGRQSWQRKRKTLNAKS